MSKSIFISRKLSADSPIRDVVNKFNEHITDLSLIDFLPVPFTPPTTQWIFFYSKTGVDQFYKTVGKDIRQYSIGCFGPQTAQYCSKLAEVSFHANANIERAVTLIDTNILENDLTFVCGSNSLRSVQRNIRRPFPEVVVYQNDPKQMDRDIGHYNVAMMTSPMNLQSFISNKGSANTYISIGQTTAKACVEKGIKSLISKHPSEQGMADTLEILMDNDQA